MNGFLPLVEAFLAFALTMLALATAVSAIVGVWMRAFRWRALGLRQSIALLYDKEIEPGMRGVGKSGAASEERPGDRIDFIAEMTFGLNLLANTVNAAERADRLAEVRAFTEHRSSDGRARELRWRFGRWRSLRFGVDYLTESQFQARLDSSSVGRLFVQQNGAQAWAERRAFLTRWFNELGQTATEGFARRARVRTVIVSLALAIGVNIDAFGLLNTYMTDRAIRRAVIAQQEEIIRQDVPVSNASPEDPSASAGAGSGIDTTIEQLQERLTELASIPAIREQNDETLRELENLVERLSSDAEAVTEAKAAFESAAVTTRGIANYLTKSFPVGWDGYPNCFAAQLDARCALVYARADGSDLAASDYLERVSSVARVDTASFIKWFLGVLLSGIMVGLGAPFWVQTVNRLLKLKEDMQGKATAQGQGGTHDGTSPPLAGPDPASAASVTSGIRRDGPNARGAATDASRGRSAPGPKQRSPAAARGLRARRAADDRLASRTQPPEPVGQD